MVRARRHAALIGICLGAGLLIWLGAGRLINSIRTPDVQEPPALMVEAQFPGMPASVVEERVAATLEMKMNGIENVERFRSRCGRDGSYSLEITFERGTDPKVAQMLVQNRVNDAMPLLPEAVRRLGVTVRKAPFLVLLLTVSTPDKTVGSSDLNNFVKVYIRPQLARIRGVAEISVHGDNGIAAPILLDPQKLAAHKLTVPDVKRAIEQQALEATSGPRGGFQFTPAARGGLSKPDQLGSIAIRSDPEGPAIRIEDVKSSMRRDEDLVSFASLDGKPAAVLAVYASAWADPRAVCAAVRDPLPELRQEVLPPGFELSGEFDFTAAATAGAPGFLLLDVDLPPAGPKESARELLARTGQSLREIPGVRHVLVLSEQPFDRERDQPCLVVGLGRADGAPLDRERILGEIRTRFNATEKSAAIRTRDLSGYPRSGSAGYPIEFAISGFDRQSLRELANNVVAKMSREPGLTGARAGPQQVPTYAVDIDRAGMARLGLTLPDVSASLQAVFGSVQAGSLWAFAREWPILLKIEPGGRAEVERLIRTNLRTSSGELISLSEVSAVHLENEPAYLERLNIFPVIVITAGLDGDLSLAEARFLCERLVTESQPELERKVNRVRWLRPMPPAKAPTRPGGAPDRAGGP